MSMPEADLATIASWLRDASHVMVLTGAGISTNSGIRDFRGPNGVWTKNPDAEKTANLHYYMSDPEIRRRAWRNRRTSEMWNAQPNAVALRARRVGAQGRAAHAGDTERRRAAPPRGAVTRDRRRDPRERAHGEVHGLRMARPDGRDAGARRGRRRRSAVPVLRRDHQVRDDLVRGEPRRRGPRTLAAMPRHGPTCSSRSVPRSASTRPRACPRSRCATAPA